MLKTLEEPPEHVKFVLATTDPQKIPVTVLSRCLQFNLKPLPPPQIGARLDAHPRARRGVALEAGGARADRARGAGHRCATALSLLDQAIAFGGGEVREGVVRTMLGTVDRDHVYRIADALAAGDGSALLAEGDALAARGLAFGAALEELASLFHRIAVAQVVPARRERVSTTRSAFAGYATRFTPETVQLAYQICAQGRADLALAPDEATGFAMTLLRMLAFEPATAQAALRRRDGAASAPRRRAGRDAVAAPIRDAPVANVAALTRADGARRRACRARRCRREANALALPDDPSAWPAFVAALKLTGMAAQLAAQTELQLDRAATRSRWRCRRRTSTWPTGCTPTSSRSRSSRPPAASCCSPSRSATPAPSVARRDRNARARRSARAKREAAFRDEPFVRDCSSNASTARSQTDQPITPLSRDVPSRHAADLAEGATSTMMKNQLAGLMKQAQQMQDNMKKAQEELAQHRGRGPGRRRPVRSSMTCRHDVKRVAIDPSLLGEDKDMLEDLVAAAINDAVRRVETTTQEKMCGAHRRACRCRPGFKLPF